MSGIKRNQADSGLNDGWIATLILILAVVVIAIRSAIYGWAFMVGVGVAHHEFDWPETTISFWPAVVLGTIIAIFAAARENTNYEQKVSR